MTILCKRVTALLMGALVLVVVSPKMSAAASGPVAGKVTSRLTGNPLANVVVKVLETGDSTQTDATGHYVFPNILNGRYTMLIGRSTYQPMVKANVFFGSCCQGGTGNVDCDPANSVDISDLSALIDNLYISLQPLCCPASANIDGQPGVDISDLSALIDFLYISFATPALCQ